MSKFNSTKTTAPIENYCDARSYALDAKTELATIVSTSFVSDGSYNSATDTINRVKELIPKTGPEFAAKAAVYARTKLGMRSISHVIAGELAQYGGMNKIRSFYTSVVQRPDDMAEIAAYHRKNYGGNRLPNSMVKGFKLAFNKFNDYQLAKYKLVSKDFSLIDLVNIVRPKPTEQNAESLRLLVSDQLTQTNTWEDKLSKAGSDSDLKAEAWADLINSESIGYLALIRNLRNIYSAVDEFTLTKALALVTSRELIEKSRIFPFQLYTAYTQIQDNRVRKAISIALDLAVSNCPDLPNTLVAVDTSGSMQRSVTGGSTTHIQSAALFGAALANNSGADLMMFATGAKYVDYDPDGTTISSMQKIIDRVGEIGHGTDFHEIFNRATKAYDRIIIISDMQCNYGGLAHYIGSYKSRFFNADPFIYSFDTAGLGTSQFNGKFATVCGLNDKVFDLIKRAEVDPRILVNTIEATEI